MSIRNLSHPFLFCHSKAQSKASFLKTLKLYQAICSLVVAEMKAIFFLSVLMLVLQLCTCSRKTGEIITFNQHMSNTNTIVQKTADLKDYILV